MNIEQPSSQPTQTAPSEVTDQAQTQEAVQGDTSSTEVQGEEQVKAAPTEGEGEELAAEEKPKKKSGIQRLKERHAREMAAIHREIEALKAQGSKGQRDDEPVSAKADGEPREEDFDSHKDYVKALAKWTYAQEKSQDEKKSKEAQAKESAEKQAKASQERLEAYRKANPDFTDALEEFVEEHGDVHRSVALIAAIDDCEMGPAVMHELLKSPDDFFRINKLSPLAAAREVGKIEARLSAKASAKPEPKTTTKAPAPLKPVTGTASGKRSISDPDIPFAEYVRLRREQMRRKA